MHKPADKVEASGSSEELKSSGPVSVLCMAAQDAKCDFAAMKLQRRAVGDYDVLIDMKYCGVCHTDLHTAAGHLSKLGKVFYPCVPGHELAGVCVAVGSKVTKVQVGSHVGVGCMVDACLSCSECKAGEEQKCKKGQIATYNAKNKHGRAAVYPPGSHTLGGYTTTMVVHEHFAINIPKTYPLEMAGPVMCAGITMYDPLKQYKAGPGKKVGIIGLGGLGVMGVKLARALGCEDVAVISRGPSKKEVATKIGATRYIDSKSEDEMKAGAGSLDVILNCIPVQHEYMVYEPLLGPGGKMVLLGLHEGLMAAFATGGGKRVTMSGIGGIRNTQEVIDLCDKHKIYPECQVVPVSKLNWIYSTLASGADAVRYVLDISTLKEGAKCDTAAPDLGPPISVSYLKLVSEVFKFKFGYR